MNSEIVIYDDHYLFVEALQCFIQREKLSSKVHTVSKWEELQEKVISPAAILIINTEKFSSTEIFTFLDEIRGINAAIRIIVISRFTEPRVIKKMFDKNVKAFLGKKSSSIDLNEALKFVDEGKVYINTDAKEALFNFICNAEEETTKKQIFRQEELTVREMDVLKLICDGLRTREIADKLYISPHTVDSHRKKIMLKFDVHSSSHLVKFALENRIVN